MRASSLAAGILFALPLLLIAEAKPAQEQNLKNRPPAFDLGQGKGDIQQLWQEYQHEQEPKENAPDGAMLNALKPDALNRWVNAQDDEGNYIIPYIISGNYDSTEHVIIEGAMHSISANSCIVFKPRTNEDDYIDLQNKPGMGCYTMVGRTSGQNIVVGTCIIHQTVVHELFHTIGLWHEHMRLDRDNYINVHWENIPKYYLPQFNKVTEEESTTYDIKYDYRSVMHYSKTAFASSPSLTTMETKDPNFQDIIGTVNDASPSDYAKVCNIYACKKCLGQPFQRGDKIIDDAGNALKPVPQAIPDDPSPSPSPPTISAESGGKTGDENNANPPPPATDGEGTTTGLGSGPIPIPSPEGLILPMGGDGSNNIQLEWNVNGKNGSWAGNLGDLPGGFAKFNEETGGPENGSGFGGFGLPPGIVKIISGGGGPFGNIANFLPSFGGNELEQIQIGNNDGSGNAASAATTDNKQPCVTRRTTWIASMVCGSARIGPIPSAIFQHLCCEDGQNAVGGSDESTISTTTTGTDGSNTMSATTEVLS